MNCLTRLAALAVLGLVVTSPSAQDPTQPYAPEYFGLAIGMPEPDMLESLSRQGFSFQPGGEYEHVRGTRQFSPTLDYALVINRDNGGLDIWDAENVILGVLGPELVAVGEINEFARFEARDNFAFIQETLEDKLGPPIGQLPRDTWRRNNSLRPAIDQLDGMLWYSAAKPPTDANPESLAWRNGDTLTVLTSHNNMTIDGRVDKRRIIITLWHLRFCDFTVFQTTWKDHGFKCESGNTDDTDPPGPTAGPGEGARNSTS